MEVTQLRWFVTLAHTEHVTDTAAEHGISQPALSRALARLEDEVGVPLFDRLGRRLRLNPYGVVLRDRVVRALAELAAAQAEIRSLADPEHGQVRLGFLPSLGTWLVPDLLRGSRQSGARWRFVLRQGYADELAAALLEGALDLVLTAPRPDVPQLSWHRVHEEKLCLAVPVGHPLAGRKRVPLSAAADEPFVALDPSAELRRLTDELCRQAGFTPRIAFESGELATVRGLVAAGLGVAVSPLPAAGRDSGHGARYVPLSDRQARRPIGLLWVKDRPAPPPVERFHRYVEGFARAGR